MELINWHNPMETNAAQVRPFRTSVDSFIFGPNELDDDQVGGSVRPLSVQFGSWATNPYP